MPLTKQTLHSLLDIIIPPACPLCEKALCVDSFCKTCLSEILSLKITSPMCTRCGEPFLKGTGLDRECGRCLTEKSFFTVARSAFIYDKQILEAIHNLKYSGNTVLAKPLGALLSEAAIFDERPDVIVPVPLHINRLRLRGFNQTLLMAKEAGQRLSLKVDYSTLKRIRDTGEQVRLCAEERQRNVAGAFALTDSTAFKDKKVLLIDDVYTTGATLRECSKVLTRAGAKVYALTLARAVKV